MSAARPSAPRLPVPAFLDHLRFERGLSEQTLEAYEHDVVRLAAFLAAAGIARRRRTVSTADLRAFVLELKDLGLAASSIGRNLSAIRTYFAFLVAESLVTADPSERLQTPKGWRTLPGGALRSPRSRRCSRRPTWRTRSPGATGRCSSSPTPAAFASRS